MEKTFSLEIPQKPEGEAYRTEILTIINDVEAKVRYVDPDEALYKELHTNKTIDSRNEMKEYESVRKDVCSAFGVSDDPSHVYVYAPIESQLKPTQQRALRAFCILIDIARKEGFYGEGRTMHNLLMNRLTAMLAAQDGKTTEESIQTGINKVPPDFLVFKGFLSTEDFREITDGSRKVLETPLFDKAGRIIKTPADWFLTGHNLEDIEELLS